MVPEPAGQQQTSEPAALEGRGYHLVLLVNGASVSSARAIQQVHAICEEHLAGRCTLRIVDVQREPEQMPDRVLAVPTLLRERPAGGRMVVGDLSDPQRVLRALGIPPAGPPRDTSTHA